MTKSDLTSVKAYIAAQPGPARGILRRVRQAIQTAAPKAVESISYGMPTYKLNGKPLFYFAGWKTYCWLYPIGAERRAAFEIELASYNFSKSTLHLSFDDAVPVKLIGAWQSFARHRSSGPPKGER